MIAGVGSELEVWRRAAGVGTWRYGGLKARCRRSDLEASGSGSPGRAVGAALWRYGGMELWTCRHGALEARCMRSDTEV